MTATISKVVISQGSAQVNRVMDITNRKDESRVRSASIEESNDLTLTPITLRRNQEDYFVGKGKLKIADSSSI
ncbi:MAG: hypothetical protein GY730_00480 [bacterium]|nr:hypothetical protein [bacterium]